MSVFFVTPKIKDISDGMLEIAKKYKEMSISARNRAVKKFDTKNWIERHKAIFEKLLTK